MKILFSVYGNMPHGYKIPIGLNGNLLNENVTENPIVYLQILMDTSNGIYQRNVKNQADIIQTTIYNFLMVHLKK